MRENTQEKSLIEKKKKSIVGIIKDFFAKMFKKKPKDIKHEVVSEEINKEKENNEFKEYIKRTENEETKLLELQRRFRNGEIGQDDLTEEQIDALCDLYDKQIEELKKSIEIKEQKIAENKKRRQQKIEGNNM